MVVLVYLFLRVSFEYERGQVEYSIGPSIVIQSVYFALYCRCGHFILNENFTYSYSMLHVSLYTCKSIVFVCSYKRMDEWMISYDVDITKQLYKYVITIIYIYMPIHIHSCVCHECVCIMRINSEMHLNKVHSERVVLKLSTE